MRISATRPRSGAIRRLASLQSANRCTSAEFSSCRSIGAEIGIILANRDLGHCEDEGGTSYLISVRLAPSIFVDDIGQRDTADWPKPTHRIADRQRIVV